MPAAEHVNSGKWSDVRVLFDNGWYSAIAGRFEDEDHDSIGQRWNGKDDHVGFPNSRGTPQWHVVPSFLADHVLHGLLEELALNAEQHGRAAEYTTAIMRELGRFSARPR